MHVHGRRTVDCGFSNHVDSPLFLDPKIAGVICHLDRQQSAVEELVLNNTQFQTIIIAGNICPPMLRDKMLAQLTLLSLKARNFGTQIGKAIRGMSVGLHKAPRQMRTYLSLHRRVTKR